MSTPKKSEKEQKTIASQDDEVVNEIAKRVSAIVGREKASVVTAQLVQLYSEKFSGPIAHPKHLREYEEICPGAADRIIRMAENSLEYENNLEKEIVTGELEDRALGRKYGFVALICLIAGAVICAIYDQEIIAGMLLGSGLIGIIGAIISGRSDS